MARRYLPSDFRQVAEVGTTKSVPNPYTGVSVPKYETLFKVHYKPHTRTLNQQYQAVQAGLTDTRVIVIRHNKKVSEGLKMKLDGVLYDIEQLSPDDTFGIGKYDFITLKKSSKVG